MSAQASGVFGVGVDPPPERSDPSALVVLSDWCVRSPRSACAIWPILSSSVMRDIRSATRWATGRFEFRYGKPWALMTTTGLSSVTSAPVADSWIGIVFASDGVLLADVWTVNVFTLPDAAPAAKVTAPLVSV